MKKNLLNISLESYDGPENEEYGNTEAPLVDLPAITNESIGVLAAPNTEESIARLRAISDVVEGLLPDSLGGRIAQIGVTVLGGDKPEITVEAFDPKAIAKAAWNIILKIMEFLKRLALSVGHWLNRVATEIAEGRKAAVALQGQAVEFQKKNPMAVVRFKTEDLDMLKFDGEIPVLATSLMAVNKRYTQDVHQPYLGWLTKIVDIAEEIQNTLTTIAKKGIDVDDSDMFDRLENLMLVAPPAQWTSSASKTGVPIFEPKSATWGGVKLVSFGDATTRVIDLTAEDANLLEPVTSAEEVIALNADMIVNYARLGVGITDQIVQLMPASKKLAKIMAQGNTIRMVQKIHPSDQADGVASDLMRRVELIGRAVTALDVISRQAVEYINYLRNLRGTISAVVAMGMTAGAPGYTGK